MLVDGVKSHIFCGYAAKASSAQRMASAAASAPMPMVMSTAINSSELELV
jgi:hypothetical protein